MRSTFTSDNHLPTCTRYCAKRHCACGRDNLHGMPTCGPCSSKPTIVTCTECWDNGACPKHDHAKVACGRCASTGQFITGTLNGKPVGPGGQCYRCRGKGFHTPTDRKRNAYYDAHQSV